MLMHKGCTMHWKSILKSLLAGCLDLLKLNMFFLWIGKKVRVILTLYGLSNAITFNVANWWSKKSGKQCIASLLLLPSSGLVSDGEADLSSRLDMVKDASGSMLSRLGMSTLSKVGVFFKEDNADKGRAIVVQLTTNVRDALCKELEIRVWSKVWPQVDPNFPSYQAHYMKEHQRKRCS